MSDMQTRLAAEVEALRVIAIRRAETGDKKIGKYIERQIIGQHLDELAAEVRQEQAKS